MFSLTIIGAVALFLAAACILAAIITGCVLEFAPWLRKTRLGRLLRPALLSLRMEVAREAASYVAPPMRRRAHVGHCTDCGRFAHITSEGDWGMRVRCKVHGIRVRRVKLIGLEPAPLVALSPVSVDTGPIEVGGLAYAITPPARTPDWLDGLTAAPPLSLPTAA